jgi:hypothetical protein
VCIAERRRETPAASRGAGGIAVLGSIPASWREALVSRGCRCRRSGTPQTATRTGGRRGRRCCSERLELTVEAHQSMMARRLAVCSAKNMLVAQTERFVLAGAAGRYDGTPEDARCCGRRGRSVWGCWALYGAIGRPAVCTGTRAALPAVGEVRVMDLRSGMYGGCFVSPGED